MKTKIYSIGFILSLCMLFSCDKGHNIKGVVKNAEGELLALTRNSVIVDSVTLKEKGDFAFKFEDKSDIPAFLTLQTKNKIIANLLVEKGENITIDVDYNSGVYSVTGSEGSELMKELDNKLYKAYLQFDSIENVIKKDGPTLDLDRLRVRSITRSKQDLIRFIITNSSSLTAYMALYKTMPNGLKMFGVENDASFFKVVADSLQKKYPNSQYVEQLKGDYNRLYNARDLRNLIESAKEIELPAIKFRDRDDIERSVEELKGKAVLINFWASWDKGSTMDNMELLNIYNKYKDKNFEIYNISLDDTKADWVRTITTQNLPWINVFAGRDSYIASLYNVLKLPTTFLINEKGEFVQRDIEIAELDKKLSTMLK